MKIKGQVLEPRPVPRGLGVAELVDDFFPAYNGARLREACQLLAEKILKPEVTLGVSLTGALTPPGFGTSVLAPMVQAGFIDYIVSTGANLYHDLHHALGLPLHRSTPFVDDRALRDSNVVRIYDIVFDFDVLLRTDRFCYEMLRKLRDLGPIASSELHHRMGALVAAAERRLKRPHPSLLAAAWRADVPIYTSSPGDSTIGMNLAALRLEGGSLAVDPSMDVNETAAIVYGATRGRKKSAVLILGGGSPKNFLLQTEPQIQEILGLQGRGHDHFIQVTDARPDTGGLSGATPSEAVSWGKVDPDKLPDAVVVYTDTAIALPILGAYALSRARRRPLKRLYRQREALVARMRRDYLRRSQDHAPAGR